MFQFFFFNCPGGRSLTQDANEPPVPIHIVTEPLQLPADFLNPSPENKLVVGFDCEGVDLCRHGKLCIMQVSPFFLSHIQRNPHYCFFLS